MVDLSPYLLCHAPFYYRRVFLEVDGNHGLGERLTLLCPDALDQEEPWKERLMMDDPSHVRPGLLLPRPVLWASLARTVLSLDEPNHQSPPCPHGGRALC